VFGSKDRVIGQSHVPQGCSVTPLNNGALYFLTPTPFYRNIFFIYTTDPSAVFFYVRILIECRFYPVLFDERIRPHLDNKDFCLHSISRSAEEIRMMFRVDQCSKVFSQLFGHKNQSNRKKEIVDHNGIKLEVCSDRGSTASIRLADIEQTINGVRQLTASGIDEMVNRKHDLDYQYSLCKTMMNKRDILPFPFERAAILLRKEKRYQDELHLCRYVEQWCIEAENNWDKTSAKHWLSPSLQRIIKRIPKAESFIS
jgi:hypothetical protein